MADNAYSRFVAWAKVILPLAALALFATMFLIARQIDPDAAIPFAEVDVERYAREARIGAPRFSGVTEDGTVVSLSAEVARPDLAVSSRMTVEGLDAQMTLPDGSSVAASAGSGAIDSAAQSLELGSDVTVTTSSGYRIEAEALIANLSRTELVSDGPVTAEGPLGRLEAGSMVLQASPSAPGAYLLVFKDGVRLVYQPVE